MSVPSKAREICTLEHGGNVYQVAIANDNKTIFTGGAEGVKMWDLNLPQTPLAHIDPLVENDRSTHTWSMKLTPDSSSLVVGGWRNDIAIIDVNQDTPTIKATLKTSSSACIALAFSPDGRICYTGHNDGTVAAWDINNQELVNKMEGHSGYANCIAVSTDGTRLWSGGDDKTVRQWDVREAKELEKRDMERGVNCLNCSPIDDWVVAGLDNSKLEIFSGSSEDKHEMNLDSWRINSVKFATSGEWFAVTTERGMLGGFSRFKEGSSPSIFKVESEKDTTSSCDISRDDTHIVTGLFGTFGNMARVYAME